MRKMYVFIFSFLIFGAVVWHVSPQVSALGTRYFDDSPGTECDFWNRDASAQWCDRNKAVRIISGSSTSVVKTQDKFRAYYALPSLKNPDGTNQLDANGDTMIDPAQFPNTLTLTITHADFCPGVSVNGSVPTPGNGNAVDVVTNGYYTTHMGQLNIASTVITNFYVGKPGAQSHLRQGLYRNSCGTDKVIQLTRGDFTATTHVAGLYYVEFEATLAGGLQGSPQACFDNPNGTNCAGILNSFTITQAGSTNARYIANVGTASGGDEGYATTIREEDENQDINDVGTNATFLARFGSDCSVGAAGVDTRVSFFDLDFNAGTQGQVRLEMQRIAPDGTVRWLDDTGVWRVARSNAGYAPPSRNGRFTYWNFHADKDYKYVLFIKNVNPILVQQFSTPFDGIYFHYDCAETPPTTVVPSLTISPTEIDPGQAAVATATLDNNGTANGTITSRTITMWYTNTPGPDPGSNVSSCVNNSSIVIAPGATSPQQTCSKNGDANFLWLCANFTATGGAGTTIDPPKIPATGYTCARVTNRPYLSVFGSDAIAGATAANGDTSPQCTAPNYNAGFLGWNKGAAGGWAGAGAEYAVQALGSINNFASAQTSAAGAPSGLAFANTGTATNGGPVSDPASGLLGGYFESIDGVKCDYTSNETPTDVNTDRTLTGMPAQNVVYVQNGNAYIDGDMLYANNSWTDITQIPSFRLVVVGGDILINKNVKTLNGTYVAEPIVKADGTTTGGTIVTCAINHVEADTSSPTYFGDCKTQLTINGSFVAQQVHFLRTFGSFSSSTPGDTFQSSGAAEKFVYGPDQWLGGISGLSSGGDTSITGLPPVL